jgi:hypothetical protein
MRFPNPRFIHSSKGVGSKQRRELASVFSTYSSMAINCGIGSNGLSVSSPAAITRFPTWRGDADLNESHIEELTLVNPYDLSMTV